MITVQNLTTVPVGSASEYAATIGSLTKISGIQRTSLGRYLRRTANSDVGGVPVAGFQRFVLFTPAANSFSSYTELRYSQVASTSPPAGAITEYSAAIGLLTKISGPQHSAFGSFPHAFRGTLAPVVMGRYRCLHTGSWLISTPSSTPAIQLPAGMIVWVSC